MAATCTSVPVRFCAWVYVFALERGYLDSILIEFVVAPFVKLFSWFDRSSGDGVTSSRVEQPRVSAHGLGEGPTRG